MSHTLLFSPVYGFCFYHSAPCVPKRVCAVAPAWVFRGCGQPHCWPSACASLERLLVSLQPCVPVYLADELLGMRPEEHWNHRCAITVGLCGFLGSNSGLDAFTASAFRHRVISPAFCWWAFLFPPASPLFHYEGSGVLCNFNFSSHHFCISLKRLRQDFPGFTSSHESYLEVIMSLCR